MYRDDEAARTERASQLIDEIARLERDRLAHLASARRLETAKRELAVLQLPAAAPRQPRPPGAISHIVVFCVSAAAAFAAYTLVF